jgi:hypothetical protein
MNGGMIIIGLIAKHLSRRSPGSHEHTINLGDVCRKWRLVGHKLDPPYQSIDRHISNIV